MAAMDLLLCTSRILLLHLYCISVWGIFRDLLQRPVWIGEKRSSLFWVFTRDRQRKKPLTRRNSGLIVIWWWETVPGWLEPQALGLTPRPITGYNPSEDRTGQQPNLFMLGHNDLLKGRSWVDIFRTGIFFLMDIHEIIKWEIPTVQAAPTGPFKARFLGHLKLL
jgi:hypothetical protein